jgi:hypothetical protein
MMMFLLEHAQSLRKPGEESSIHLIGSQSSLDSHAAGRETRRDSLSPLKEKLWMRSGLEMEMAA